MQLPIRAKSKIDRLSTITYPNPAGSLAAGAYLASIKETGRMFYDIELTICNVVFYVQNFTFLL
ncbi:hypothetical protein MASR2M41_14180 [Flammeovirgaceae bacterium]